MRDLSIIIPAFNEQARIPVTLTSIADYLAGSAWNAEVIVVDDGSTDRTVAIVEAMSYRFDRLRVVQSPFNGGKGRAVRLGMLAAIGHKRLFLDADNSTDVSELDRLLDAADSEPVEPAVVIGSIAHHREFVGRQQSALRRFLGRTGNRIIQRAVLPGIEDSQRGFKVFSGEAADRIFSKCRVDGWAFDVEALAIARAYGYHVLEVPVNWSHCDDSRVRAGSYLQTLGDVMKIRHDLRSDTYRISEPV